MPIRMLHTAQVGPRLWWDPRSGGPSSLRFAEQRGKTSEKILLSWCFKPGLTSNVIIQRILCSYFSLYQKIGQLAVKQQIQCVA